jgi:hypothetical protein
MHSLVTPAHAGARNRRREAGHEVLPLTLSCKRCCRRVLTWLDHEPASHVGGSGLLNVVSASAARGAADQRDNSLDVGVTEAGLVGAVVKIGRETVRVRSGQEMLGAFGSESAAQVAIRPVGIGRSLLRGRSRGRGRCSQVRSGLARETGRE